MNELCAGSLPDLLSRPRCKSTRYPPGNPAVVPSILPRLAPGCPGAAEKAWPEPPLQHVLLFAPHRPPASLSCSERASRRNRQHPAPALSKSDLDRRTSCKQQLELDGAP